MLGIIMEGFSYPGGMVFSWMLRLILHGRYSPAWFDILHVSLGRSMFAWMLGSLSDGKGFLGGFYPGWLVSNLIGFLVKAHNT